MKLDYIWQEILLSKYVKGECLSGIKHKNGDSHFWSSLMKIKSLFYQHNKKKLGDGRNARFWEDWVDDKPLKDAYPSLYFISNDHNISVFDDISKGWQQFTFRRTLYGETIKLWDSLKSRCEEVRMYGGKDVPMWMLSPDRKFSVKSLYLHLVESGSGFPQKFLWKIKVHAKIKFFLWLLNKKKHPDQR